MSNLGVYLENAESEIVAKILQEQWIEALSKHTVHCPCGQIRAIEVTFRCLYCGIWFCFKCAEEHFGETLKERLAKRK